MDTIYFVELRGEDIEHWSFDQYFDSQELADLYIESEMEHDHECGVNYEYRTTVYGKVESIVFEEKVDYSDYEYSHIDNLKPELESFTTTSYEGDWRATRQNPYAYIPEK